MTLQKIVNNRKILLKIIDTAGQEEYDYIRRGVYEKVCLSCSQICHVIATVINLFLGGHFSLVLLCVG